MDLYPEYRRELVGLVNSIDNEIGLEEENAVLILHKLNTVEKISEFGKWVRSKLDGEKLMATETEICRAAVQIAKRLTKKEWRNRTMAWKPWTREEIMQLMKELEPHKNEPWVTVATPDGGYRTLPKSMWEEELAMQEAEEKEED